MEGNMSHELTFRQKSVRIAASAAICGLSISFLIGEAVDQKAKSLRQWVNDPALLPAAYLPLQPMQLITQEFRGQAFKNMLVAANSRIPVQVADQRAIRQEFKAFEVYRAVSAAPAAVAAAAAAQLAPAAAPVPGFASGAQARVAIQSATPSEMPVHGPQPLDKISKTEAELKPAEVEGILLSIHTATAKLSSTGVQHASAAAKTELTAPKGTTEEPPPPSVVYNPPKPSQTVMMAATTLQAGDQVIEADQLPGATWAVKGKITNTSVIKEPGHFEVGIYTKIDSEGVPIGFPIRAQTLPPGKMEFQLDVPAKIPSGFLFGAFVPSKGNKRIWIAPSVNPWVKGDRQYAELALQREDVITTAMAAPAAVVNQDQWTLSGTVDTLFAKPGTRIMQPDVVVKVRGRKEATRTDKDGRFSLELAKVSGTIFLELLKPGYHPTIVPVNADNPKPVSAQLASREAIERMAGLMGAHQGTLKGVFIGQAAGADGKGLRGFTAEMSLRAEGPFYFTEQGFPTSEKKQTTSDGRFIFFNVEPGTGYVETSLNGENIAPFQISFVEGGELSLKTLVAESGQVKGRLFNPVSANGKLLPVAGARVRLEGSSEWVTTDSFGAFSVGAAKWIRGEKAALEFSAEKFNNHRYTIDFAKHKEALNLYAFPANYIRRLARTMDVDLDPYTGIVFGKASGPALRMDALADHSTVNGAKDFYFDGAGRLRSSHNMTDPRYGTYVIFNVPKGRSLLQGNDGNGKLRLSDSIVSNPSSVTVVMD